MRPHILFGTVRAVTGRDASRPPGRPFRAHLEPGQRVRMSAHPEWGTGQVQSAIGERVTINFEHAGKVLVNARTARIEPWDDPAG